MDLSSTNSPKLSNEKRAPGYLLYIGDEILPSYIGIIIHHYKDPYKPTSIMESRSFFFFVAQMSWQVSLTAWFVNGFYR